jgi:YidC/Oxa1 family membrane protein insertase
MSNNKQDFQKRFMIAIGLSVAILLGWTYFFPPAKPTPNANTAAVGTDQTAAAPQQPQQAAITQPLGATYEVPKDAAPVQSKLITVDANLYTVKLDTRGAVPVSWILKKNKTREGEVERPLASIAGKKSDAIPLELISQKGLENSPREVPLRIITGDAATDLAVNENAYQVSGADSDNIVLTGNDTKKLEFTMTDPATGLEAVKTFTFHANSFVSDLQVKLSKSGQFVPNTRIVIGPSIADQGVKKHHFYRSESEAVSYVNNDVDRHQPTKIADTAIVQGTGHILVNGTTDWAAVGDAYFAMAVVPAQPAPSVEYTGNKYDFEIPAGTREGQSLFQWAMGTNDSKEVRHLTTALLPIVADGSINKVFVGAKDHFGFSNENGINQDVNFGLNRKVDLENMINYGWYPVVRFILRPLTLPIVNGISLLNNLTGSYGLAIIIFTAALYSLFFPLKLSSAKSMKKAQKHQPRMKEIQEQMKKLKADDPKMRELQMEQLRLMKESNFIGGCLPMLLQIPFFIALYTAITISLDFRQATFLWLPDLSAFDPYHMLEFAMAGSMALTMIFAPAAPAMTQEQQTQQKMMGYIMPVMMLWVLWGAPAGLLLYWFMGNLVTISQQFIINRMNKTPEDPQKMTPGSPTLGAGPKKMKAKLSTT